MTLLPASFPGQHHSATGHVPDTEPARLVFSDFELLPQARRLFKGGAEQRVGGRAFDLLCVLTGAPLQRHSADSLRKAVWGDSEVNANNLRVQIVVLRKLLGPQAISFQASKGYRFELPVLRDDARLESRGEPARVVRTGNLPAVLPRLWGRDAVVNSLAASVTRMRLITLQAEWGTGASAVALAGAFRADHAFRDGVWVVDLAPLDKGRQVLGAVALAMNLVLPSFGALQALGAMLAKRQALLVLDQCEHVASTVAELSDFLLRSAPGVHLLCTSRVPTKAAGERLWPLDPLALPERRASGSGPHSAAVTLFLAEVEAHDPTLQLLPADLVTVASLCCRLHGLPLALILAAARYPSLGASGLLRSLEERLAFGPIAGRSGDERHLVQQAVLDWTHSLLDAQEQKVFRGLSVFVGGFSLDAVLHVLGDDGQDITGLLACLQSLVRYRLVAMLAPPSVGDMDTVPRYTLHEIVRSDARRRLKSSGEESRLRTAHAAHFVGSCQRWNRSARAFDEPVSGTASANLNNLRHALDWWSAHDPTRAMQLCADCFAIWQHCGCLDDVRRHITQLLALPREPGQDLLRVDLLLHRCVVDHDNESFDAVEADAEHALHLLQEREEPGRRGRAMSWKAAVCFSRGELQHAEATYLQSLVEHRRAHNAAAEADAHASLGGVLLGLAREDEARQRLQIAVLLGSRADDERTLLLAHHHLGQLELSCARPAGGVLLLERAVLGARRTQQRCALSRSLSVLGLARMRLGQIRRALDCVGEALEICQQQNFRRALADACVVLSSAMLETRQPKRALALSSLARRQVGTQIAAMPKVIQDELLRVEQLTTALLDSNAQALAGAQGEQLSVTEAAAWAAALT